MSTTTPVGLDIGNPALHALCDQGMDGALQEFHEFLRLHARPIFLRAAALSNYEAPIGNIGSLLPIHFFLSLCGLPPPDSFIQWDAPPTAYTYFLLRNPHFFLDAQASFFGLLTHTLYSHYYCAEIAVRRFPERKVDWLRKKAEKKVGTIPGLGHLVLTWNRQDPVPRLYWVNNREIRRASTIDEWFSVTSNISRVMSPGDPAILVEPKQGADDFLPFFAAEKMRIETGVNAGKILFRNCIRPNRAPVLLHYNLLPDHPLSKWLSGHVTLPDQLLAPDAVLTSSCAVGEWAALPASHPWRHFYEEHLRQNVTLLPPSPFFSS